MLPQPMKAVKPTGEKPKKSLEEHYSPPVDLRQVALQRVLQESLLFTVLVFV